MANQFRNKNLRTISPLKSYIQSWPYGNNGVFNNSGTTTLASGSVYDYSSFTNSGVINITGNAGWVVIGCSGNFSNTGTINYNTFDYSGASHTFNYTDPNGFTIPSFNFVQQPGGNGGKGEDQYFFDFVSLPGYTGYYTLNHIVYAGGGLSQAYGNGGPGGMGRVWAFGDWNNVYQYERNGYAPTSGAGGGFPRWDAGNATIAGGSFPSGSGQYISQNPWGTGSSGAARGYSGGAIYINAKGSVTVGTVNLNGSAGGNGGWGAAGPHGVGNYYANCSGGGGGGAGGNGGILYIRRKGAYTAGSVNVSGGAGGSGGPAAYSWGGTGDGNNGTGNNTGYGGWTGSSAGLATAGGNGSNGSSGSVTAVSY